MIYFQLFNTVRALELISAGARARVRVTAPPPACQRYLPAVARVPTCTFDGTWTRSFLHHRLLQPERSDWPVGTVTEEEDTCCAWLPCRGLREHPLLEPSRPFPPPPAALVASAERRRVSCSTFGVPDRSRFQTIVAQTQKSPHTATGAVKGSGQPTSASRRTRRCFAWTPVRRPRPPHTSTQATLAVMKEG